MKIFSYIYGKMMKWARHRHAPCYLGAVSFIESSFFIIPPDVMLAPMSLSQPERARWFALLTTITSVLGGLFGYLIGYGFFALVHPYIVTLGYEMQFQQIMRWFQLWGFWVVLVAGFSPIPYKIFTISAGVFGIDLVPFAVASLLSRGARFFLVAEIMRYGGQKMEQRLHFYIDWIGWGTVLLLGLGLAIYYLL